MLKTLGEKYREIIRRAPAMSGYSLQTLETFKEQKLPIDPGEIDVVYEICKLVVLTLEGIPWPENADHWLGLETAQ